MYNEIINNHIDQILNEVYYNPISKDSSDIKKGHVITNKHYIEYLESLNIITCIQEWNGLGIWAVQLEPKGLEVLEKYKGWNDYKKKVVDKQVEKVQAPTLRLWIPILIIAIAVIILTLLFVSGH